MTFKREREFWTFMGTILLLCVLGIGLAHIVNVTVTEMIRQHVEMMGPRG